MRIFFAADIAHIWKIVVLLNSLKYNLRTRCNFSFGSAEYFQFFMCGRGMWASTQTHTCVPNDAHDFFFSPKLTSHNVQCAYINCEMSGYEVSNLYNFIFSCFALFAYVSVHLLFCFLFLFHRWIVDFSVLFSFHISSMYTMYTDVYIHILHSIGSGITYFIDNGTPDILLVWSCCFFFCCVWLHIKRNKTENAHIFDVYNNNICSNNDCVCKSTHVYA